MKRFSQAGGLVLLNAALLLALAFVTFGGSADAQGFRARGNFHAVPGTAPGVEADVVFVVDEVNQQLIALTFDPNTKTVSVVGGRDLALDAAQIGRGRN